MKKLLITLSMLTILVSAGAEPLDAFKGKQGTINISGGTAHIPVMRDAAQRIMKTNPNIRITVAGGGSGAGVKMVGEGLVQIGNTGRALKADEIKNYGLVSFAFAIDGVAVAVHPQNPVSELSQQQLADIYSGKITNWQQVGGKNAPITLYTREDGSGTRETFETLAIKNSKTISSANVVNSNGAMKTAVSRNPNAIGYVGIGHLNHQIKGIILDGMKPSQQNATNGSYRVTRLLYMNTKGNPQGIVADFINYIYSADGRKIITKSGYIPVNRK